MVLHLSYLFFVFKIAITYRQQSAELPWYIKRTYQKEVKSIFVSAEKIWKCEKNDILKYQYISPIFWLCDQNSDAKMDFFTKFNQKMKEYVYPYLNYLVPSPQIHYFFSYNSICHHNCYCGMRKNPYFFISSLVDDK